LRPRFNYDVNFTYK